MVVFFPPPCLSVKLDSNASLGLFENYRCHCEVGSLCCWCESLLWAPGLGGIPRIPGSCLTQSHLGGGWCFEQHIAATANIVLYFLVRVYSLQWVMGAPMTVKTLRVWMSHGWPRQGPPHVCAREPAVCT